MDRVHCPKHPENTPSCVIYETHAYCYGGCGRIELSELGRVVEGSTKERYREDLEETRKYIDGLPTKVIRGFNLPYDSRGYYLQFPGTDYYKFRVWDKNSKDKYRGPAGHTKPPFWAARAMGRSLAVCEGEINSLSVSRAFPEWDVVSPGSASDFKTDKTINWLLTYCIRYCTIVVIVDKDAPGVGAAIHVKGGLVNKVPDTQIVLMDPDPNDWFCSSGKEALRQEIEKKLSERL